MANAGPAPNWDRTIALENLYNNLIRLRKLELAEHVLEQALQRPEKLANSSIYHFQNLLAARYIQERKIDRLRSLTAQTTGQASLPLQARLEIVAGNFARASAYLQRMSSQFSYLDLADVWELFFARRVQGEALRTHYRIMQNLPTLVPASAWQKRMAGTYSFQKQYARAAREFRKLSLYDYSDPEPSTCRVPHHRRQEFVTDWEV